MNNQFVFVACKIGFENACKAEVLASCSNLKFSFSRPGFLTFKISSGAADFSTLNKLTFVRTSGTNIGKTQLVTDKLEPDAENAIEKIVTENGIRHLFWWSREVGAPDDKVLLDFMDNSENCIPDFARKLAARCKLKVNHQARIGDTVLNLIEVDSGNIWYSIHQVSSPHQSWPGGIARFSRPESLISRAYLKTREAIIWSRFPFKQDETCVEIGCAPGGSVAALLESGMHVVGIDPANVDEKIANHPNFIHIRKRGAEVKKKLLKDAKWLFVDSNVAPQFTLDMVEDIATSQHLHLKGMILTLKLLDSKMTESIGSCRDRVKQMGFQYVRTRQLAFNRNEVCLAALKRKSILRFGKQSGTSSNPLEPGNEPAEEPAE